MSAALELAPPASATRPLAILAAARSLPFHSFGGMQAIAWDVLKGLAALGHDVTVLTTAISGGSAAFEHDGVRVVPLEGTVPERYSSAFWRASRAEVERTARRYDAVLGVSAAAAGLVPLKRTFLAVPWILQVHGSAWAEALTKWRSARPVEWAKSARNVFWLAKDARLYRAFEQLVFVGDGVARQFAAPPLRWMTRDIARATIANGVDSAVFRFDRAARARTRARYGFTAHDRVAVFSARLHPRKGAAEALHALAVLRSSGRTHKLLIAGDGGEAESLRRLAAELDCEDAVAFAGAVPRARVAELLCAGDAFVFPALGREGLPLNVLEALAVGLPCVCADTLRETFGALGGIVYAPPRDAHAVAAAIEQSSRHARSRATLLPLEYSLDRCVLAYETLLRRWVGS
jgi:glycosyltransferase involved in cell wall biosynthesis